MNQLFPNNTPHLAPRLASLPMQQAKQSSFVPYERHNGLSGMLTNEASFQNFYRNFTAEKTYTQVPNDRRFSVDQGYGSEFATRYQNDSSYEWQELDTLRQDIESAYKDSQQSVGQVSSPKHEPAKEANGKQEHSTREEPTSTKEATNTKEELAQELSTDKQTPKTAQKNEKLVTKENLVIQKTAAKEGKVALQAESKDIQKESSSKKEFFSVIAEGEEVAEKGILETGEKPEQQIHPLTAESKTEVLEKTSPTKRKEAHQKSEQTVQKTAQDKPQVQNKPQIQVIDERSTTDQKPLPNKEIATKELSSTPAAVAATVSENNLKKTQDTETVLLTKVSAAQSSRNKIKKPQQQGKEYQQDNNQAQEKPFAKQDDSSFTESTSSSHTRQTTSTPTVLRSFAQQMAQRLQEGPLAQNLRQLQFRFFDQNRGEIRLRLNPESLGHVRIHLNINGSQLSGHIATETAEAARIMQENMQHLESSLRDGGFESFAVSVSGGQAEDSGAATQDPAHKRDYTASKHNEETWEDLTESHILVQQEQSAIDFTA